MLKRIWKILWHLLSFAPNKFLPASWCYKLFPLAIDMHPVSNIDLQDYPQLSTQLFDIKLQSPIGNAGGMDKNAEYVSKLAKFGFSLVELGSVTVNPRQGNLEQCNLEELLCRFPRNKSVVNRMGMPNVGIEKFIENLRTNLKKKEKFGSTLLGFNLAVVSENDSNDLNYIIEQYIKDFSYMINKILECMSNDYEEMKYYLTLNLSCPNVRGKYNIFSQEYLSKLLSSIVKIRDSRAKNVPVFIKISPDIDDSTISEITSTIKQYRKVGILLTNTSLKLNDNKFQGGISGSPLFNRSTELISKFYIQLGNDIPIIAAGGALTPEDVYKKILYGATAVQLYTAIIYHGFSIIDDTHNYLLQKIKENNLSSIKDLIGKGISDSQ